MNSLKRFIRDASIEAARGHLRIRDVKEQELSGDLAVLGRWMAIVLVACPELRILFKVHFGANRVGPGFGEMAEQERLRLSRDFMAEYCNLVAGLLKKGLLNAGAKPGVSLPLSLPGFDEVYAPQQESEDLLLDRWLLRSGDLSLNFSVLIELLDARRVGSLELPGLGGVTSDGGEIEWLDAAESNEGRERVWP